MGFEAGRDAVFKIDNATPTLTDISAFLDNVDFPEEVEMGETTVLGKTSRTFIVTLKNSTISISGRWDGAAGQIDATLSGIYGLAASQTFEYGPGGAASGDVRYTGECHMTNYTKSSSFDGVTSFSASFQVTDDVTRNTFP